MKTLKIQEEQVDQWSLVFELALVLTSIITLLHGIANSVFHGAVMFLITVFRQCNDFTAKISTCD